MSVEDVNEYNGDSIEVLEGLDPVRTRPGMYTDTSSPNHLGMEVIDNSVDEALAGFADRIDVTLYEDQSLEVADNGRGMPVDIHSKEKVPAVELIFGRLHAGGKFSNRNYAFSGGLHGVGVSVVNALSSKLEAEIKRDGQVYKIGYSDGNKTEDLHVIGEVGRRNTGTKIRFWPNPKYFDRSTFRVSSMISLLKAKAVLCPGLTINFYNALTKEKYSWCFKGDLKEYLVNTLGDMKYVPEKSGLNQWNAGGRERQADEVYIPIPAKINSNFPNFFPNIDTTFTLHLPNGSSLSAKPCQQNRKALMSNPNIALGKWILRDILQVKEGELVTIEHLYRLGFDSVVVYKDSETDYRIDVCKTMSYSKDLFDDEEY